MKALNLGDGLSLPLAAVTEKLAWLGRTGSGKTYGAMKLAELMLDAGAQIGVIDPVGVWRGLRVPAKKGGRSFPIVVFGGLPGGDLPLEPTAGELVADLVSDRGLSFVLDVSQMLPSEQQRFVRDFGGRFFQRRKAAPAAVHLFLEECQEFIPENPSGLEAQTLGVMQRLWKLGRNFGIGGSLISQRPQEIAKKALNMSGTLFAFQMTGPQERKAIKAWVADHGVATDIEAVLQRLAVGHPHVESPTFLQVSKTIAILPRETADLSSTPTVVGGAQAPRPLTPIDVEQLTAAMAATIEKAKADDPKVLRARIAELEQTARTAARGIHAPGKNPQPEVREVLTAADRELLRAVAARLTAMPEELQVHHTDFALGVADGLAAAIDKAIERAMEKHAAVTDRARAEFAGLIEKKGLTRILEKLDRVTVAPTPTLRISPSTNPSLATPGPTRDAAVKLARIVVAGADVPSGTLDGAQQKIVDVAAMLAQRGIPPSRDCIARWLDIHPNGGRYGSNLAALRAAGLLDGAALTDAGRRLARPMVTGLQGARVPLDGGQRAIVELLELNSGKRFTRETLAQALGIHPNGGRYGSNLARLRVMGLIPDRGDIYLTDEAHR